MPTQPQEWLIFKRLTIQSAGNEVEQLNLSYVASGKQFGEFL